jgi:HAD superfamily phosphoserine phosphatase-like hydrolase
LKNFFISYNKADRRWAEWIAWQLEEAGYTTIVQAWDFTAGGNFVLDMQKASNEAERTIAVLSEDYLQASFTQPEWASAFAQDPTGEKGLLLPVRVQECKVEGLLRSIVYIDLVGLDQETAKSDLLKKVQQVYKKERAKPDIAPVFPGGGPRSITKKPQFPPDLAAKAAADLGPYFKPGALSSPEGHRGIFHQPRPGWSPSISKNRWRYKVVAFDLDGTLVRGDGFQFSWEAIWNGLGFSKSVQTDLKREYRQKSQASHDHAESIQAYIEWCRKACNHFMVRKLHRETLSNFIKPLRLTNNFLRALTQMRKEGFVLAIISGGINCFLEEKVPDFREWFDFVFINELIFDEKGFLSDVVATEFDFEGKAKALAHVCERAGCGYDETVFVGDAFNDEAIMLSAGRSIAYPPKDRPVEGVSQVLIYEDNLELILPHVCVE